MGIIHLGYDSDLHTPNVGDVFVVVADGLVEPQAGGGGGGATTLDGLNDVVITTPADNEVLAFDNASGDWINQTAAEAGLATSGHNHDGSYASTTHIHDAADVTTGTFANARISEASVTQHQAALTITESQISDLSHTAVGTAPPAVPTGDAIIGSTPYSGTSNDAARADHKHFFEPNSINFIEGVQDIVGGMVTGNTETDIDVTYDDAAGKLNFVVTGAGSSTLAGLSDVTITTPADNEVLAYDSTSSEWINQTPAEAGLSAVGHGHVSTDISDFAEAVSDQVGTMVTGNTETGINVTYDDTDNTLDFVLAYDVVTPVGLVPDGTSLVGTANAPARRDHRHSTPAASAVGLSNSSTNTEGTSGSFARADHTHAITGFALTSHNHDAANIATGTFADARIAQSNVTQHQAALVITESQISDLGAYPDATGQPITKIPQTDGAGGWTFIDTPSGGGGHPHVNTVEISDGTTVKWEIDLEVDGTLSFNYMG